MKVTFITTAMPPDYSGASVQVLKTCRALKKKGYNVNIITFKRENSIKGYDIIEGFEVYRIDKKNNRFLSFIYSLIKLLHLNKNNCTIIISGINKAIIYFVFLAKNKKVILRTTLYNEDDIDSILKKIPKFLHNKFKQKINKVICTSKLLFDGYLSHNYNAILIKNSFEKIYFSDEEIMQYKEYLCKNHHLINIETFDILITVGAVCERKGTMEMVQAFNEFLDENRKYNKNAVFIIVGPFLKNNSEGTEKYLKELNKYHYSTSHKNKIIFTEVLPYRFTNYLLSKSKIYVSFSNNEGSPNGLIEAISYGCLPIVKKITGITEEIIPNDIKELIGEINKKEEIKLAIKKVFDLTGDEYAFYRSLVYKFADKNFNISNNVQKLQSIL